MDATIWLNQNMLKLTRLFGAYFQGHKEALELLLHSLISGSWGSK